MGTLLQNWMIFDDVREGNQTPVDISRLCQRNFATHPDISKFLHIFPRNDQVDHHNLKMIQSLSSNITIESIDSIPSGVKISDKDNLSSGLSKSLRIAVGAKVMMIRNVNTSDGLVNGSHGVVTDFIKDKNQNVLAVLVEFHDKEIGKITR